MDLVAALRQIVPVLRSQGRLIRLPADRTIVFVGDTHGDLDATERVFDRYRTADGVVVFLGDAVDRGPDSDGNLRRILLEKLERPEAVHLLMGNHEAWTALPFAPATFWESLDQPIRNEVSNALRELPFAAFHPGGILGLHGALPDLPDARAIESVTVGSEAWQAMTWGDWDGEDGGMRFGCRPVFGERTFRERAERLGVRVLVRSHQPDAPDLLFDDRCLTLFTSNAYGSGPRRVARIEPGQAIASARDLRVETID